MSTLSTFYTSCHHLFSTKIIYTLNHTPMVVLSRFVACARNNLVNSTQFYLYFFHYTESRYVILRVKPLLSTQSSLHRGAEQRGRLCSGHRLLPLGADRSELSHWPCLPFACRCSDLGGLPWATATVLSFIGVRPAVYR